METLAYVLPIIVLIAIAAFAQMGKGRAGKDQPFPLEPKRIMTSHELAFAEKLIEALADFDNVTVFPQVSMGAFLQVKAGTDRQRRATVLNKILKKRPDFVLADSDTNVLLLIELDDKTHNNDRDSQRDELALAAGIHTLRFRNARKLAVAEIRSAISPHLRATA